MSDNDRLSGRIGVKRISLDLLHLALEEPNPDRRYLRVLLDAISRNGLDPAALYSEAVALLPKTFPPAPPYDQVRPEGPPLPPTS